MFFGIIVYVNIRKYPSANNDRDAIVAPKRGAKPKLGTFGAVVAVYRLAFESVEQSDTNGKLYFPVDSESEAVALLTELQKETEEKQREDFIMPRPLYEKVYFVPNGDD